MQILRKLSKSILIVALLISPLIAWTQRYNIYDWWRLRNYNPPARVVQLADATTMNDYGRKLFYVHRPELEDKKLFNYHCQGGEQTIILGCFISNKGIYLFDVQDPRLQGVHEVTAAHEMLHAAYDRLGAAEKRRVNDMLENFFESLQDERIKATIEAYRSRDPSVVANELHSILATEVRNLNPELETYYKKYFWDRIRVVSLSEQYEQAFTDLKNRVAMYDAQLVALKQRIEKLESDLETTGNGLTTQRAQLDAFLAANQIERYNAGVADFNRQVRTYNNQVATARNLINEYNKIVAERNAVAYEEQKLVEALDSRVSTEPEE